MNELKKRLEQAYAWLSKIPVSGEAVDAMAMARQELRVAFKLAEGYVEKKEDENNG